MRWIAAGVVAVAIALAVWLFTRSSGPPRRAHAIRSGKLTLDAGAFKRLRDARAERAKRLAKEHPRKRSRGVAEMRLGDLARRECRLGPAALCDSLADLLANCDEGDAASCFALGQFVADNPPRTLLGAFFFFKACDLGDGDACSYVDKLWELTAPQQACADDPFLCGWRAQHEQDLKLFEEACALGVADSCVSVSGYGADEADEPAKVQSYLEQGCQLGSPTACWSLANRLEPDCEERQIGESHWTTCFPIDEALAAEARTIACEAGWGDGCSYNP